MRPQHPLPEWWPVTLILMIASAVVAVAFLWALLALLLVWA